MGKEWVNGFGKVRNKISGGGGEEKTVTKLKQLHKRRVRNLEAAPLEVWTLFKI